ncbi:MAG TPA: hypothetical protein VK541_02345, partial [Pedobacter sp.]|uniref:hypothetical protein n=1 Tax=Pedobacter sp. TaxID=1411316 RepID=UPI002B7F67EF
REGGQGQGEQRYFQALARQKLGQNDGNEAVFNELVAPPVTNPSANTAAVRYSAGLGYAGKDDKDKARKEFNAALAIAPDFLSAQIALNQL